MMTRDLLLANASYVSLLLNHRRMTYQELKRIAALSDSDLSSALGWLLCEGELFVSMEDGREYLELRMDYDF